MLSIKKKLVTDENMRPVAVQIDYDDWLVIEARLRAEEPQPSEESDLAALADAARPHWKGGDGLEYQRRIRAEWTRPWDPEAEEDA